MRQGLQRLLPRIVAGILILAKPTSGGAIKATCTILFLKLGPSCRETTSLTSLDTREIGAGKSALTIYGTISGKVKIITSFGTYSYKDAASVNALALAADALPKIEIILATNGGGLKIIEGGLLRIKK